MNGLMKRLSAVAMAVGMLMTTNISHLPTEPFIANAAESETSDAEETVHIWMERQMSVGMMMKKQSSIFLRQSNWQEWLQL